MPRIVQVVLSLALVVLLGVSSSRGDALVVVRAMTAETICEISIEPGLVRTELEIGARDLKAFENLLPDSLMERLGLTPTPIAERLPRFLAEDWTLEADGQHVPGRIVALEGRKRLRRDEITGEPLPLAEGEEVEGVLFVVFEHALPEDAKTLVFHPPEGQPGFVGAEIGFVVFHRGVPVNDFRYLPAESTLDLDWEDPWFSKFRNRNLRRRYDSPVSGFLYVDPFEVRKEIIARPLDLQPFVDLGLEGKDVIEAGTQSVLKEKVAAFLAERCPVTIDGKTVEPVLDRIHFVRRTLRTTGVIDPPEDLSVLSATLGIIFVYPVKGLPQRAAMTWDLFGDRLQKIPVVATDEAGGLPGFVTPEDPVLEWQNFLKNPTRYAMAEVEPPPPPREVPLLTVLLVLAIVGTGIALLVRRRREKPVSRALVAVLVVAIPLAWFLQPVARIRLGASTDLEAEAARPVVTGLLTNVYRAFDFRDEGDVYDVLEQSVQGDLLRTTYLETKRSLVLESQGGARVKVRGVELVDATTEAAEDGNGFRARCVWNVAGDVGHWGHIHQRRNRYEAVLTVRPVDGVWKITDLELLDEKRL